MWVCATYAVRANDDMRLPNWYRVESHGVRYYRAFNLHAAGMVAHGFSTRLGGFSSAPYATLNLGLTVEDDGASVLANRQRYAAALGLDAAGLVVPEQVHSNLVGIAGRDHAGAGSVYHGNAVAGADALITNLPHLPLALHFADCACVMLLDPEKRAIGVVHAGWKGTVAGIVSKTVEAMVREFGTSPSLLLAAIGPSIGRCCYNVGEDVARQFFLAFDGDERAVSRFSSSTWRADIKTANRMLLWRAGVQDRNIAVSEHCTCCSVNEFFSYRGEGHTGRMGGWMAIV